MRKYWVSALLATFITSIALHAQETEKNSTRQIVGSGNVVVKNIPVQSFDELDISAVVNVLLIQGSKEEVRIEADDNLQELFEVKNVGSRLNIGMKKDVRIKSNKKLKVYVTFRKIKSLDLKTVGNVSSEGSLSFDDLDLNNKSVGNVDLTMAAKTVNVENKSVGNVKLTGKANSAVIKNKSVGNLQAAGFVVQTMEIDNNGVGNAEVNAEKELKVKKSGLGKVTNKGGAVIKQLKEI